MATLTITPASGDVIAKGSVCRIDVSEETSNEVVGVVASGPERRLYIITEDPDGVEQGRSERFAVSSAGLWTWNSYVFPSAGAWTVRLRKVADDADVTTLAVTVA